MPFETLMTPNTTDNRNSRNLNFNQSPKTAQNLRHTQRRILLKSRDIVCNDTEGTVRIDSSLRRELS